MPGTFAPTKDVVDKAGLSPIVEDVADAQLLHSVPWGAGERLINKLKLY